MSTEEETGDTATANEAEDLVAARKMMPPQLRRLPMGHLRRVLDALVTLRKAGLNDVPNLEEVQVGVSNTVALREKFQTTYSAMSDWARTPAMWCKALRPCKSALELGGLGKEEMEAKIRSLQEAQAALRTEKVGTGTGTGTGTTEEDDSAAKKTRARERGLAMAGGLNCLPNDEKRPAAMDAAKRQFETWFEAMEASAQDLELMADASWSPKSLGAGSGVLFYVTEETFPPPAGKKEKGPESTTDTGEQKSWPILKQHCAVTVHVGGAGCGMGAALWQRLLAEHQIGSDGKCAGASAAPFGNAAVHFRETGSGQWVPRTMFMDPDPAGLLGAQALGCVAADDIVAGSEGDRGNWAAYEAGACGAALLKAAEDALRKQVEQADYLSCVLMTHSLYGGAGAAFGSKLARLVHHELMTSRTVLWSLSLTPSLKELQDNPGLIYPTASTIDSMGDLSGLMAFMDNQAAESLAKSSYGISEPGQLRERANYFAGSVIASITSPLRMGTLVDAGRGWRCMPPYSAMVNLTPYRAASFCVPFFGPTVPEKTFEFCGDTPSTVAFNSITNGCLHSSDDGLHGRFSITGVLYGRDVGQQSLMEAIGKHKRKRSTQWVDWNPSCWAVGSHADPSVKGGLGEVIGFKNIEGIGGTFGKWSNEFECRLRQDAGDDDTGTTAEPCEVYKAMMEHGVKKEDLDAIYKGLEARKSDYEAFCLENPEEDEEDY